jgi:glycosyltransferase involved in cell wall biosynthesis
LPSVSVVIPVYNGAAYLEQALASILRQNVGDVEIVVVDDGSTDDTPRVLDGYRGRIMALRQANGGMASARTRGIRAARGELVAFVDADDYWLDDKLAPQLSVFARRPDVGLVYSNALFQQGNRLLPQTLFDIYSPHRGRVFDKLLIASFIPVASVVVRRQCLDAVGLFDERLIICADYDLWLRLAARYDVDYVDAPLVVYRRHDGNITHNVEHALREAIGITRRHAVAAELAKTRRVRRRLSNLSWQLGMVHLEQGNLARARATLLEAARLDPSAPRPYAAYLLSFIGGHRAVRALRRAWHVLHRPPARSRAAPQT